MSILYVPLARLELRRIRLPRLCGPQISLSQTLVINLEELASPR